MLCSDTWPNFFASIIAAAPGKFLLVMFVLLLIAGVPAFLPSRRPIPLTEFDSLQVKDHEVSAENQAIKTIARPENTVLQSATDNALATQEAERNDPSLRPPDIPPGSPSEGGRDGDGDPGGGSEGGSDGGIPEDSYAEDSYSPDAYADDAYGGSYDNPEYSGEDGSGEDGSYDASGSSQYEQYEPLAEYEPPAEESFRRLQMFKKLMGQREIEAYLRDLDGKLAQGKLERLDMHEDGLEVRVSGEFPQGVQWVTIQLLHFTSSPHHGSIPGRVF